MINKGEVPEGYKKTKVGIIPEDWEVKRLGEISNKITDGTHDTPKVVEKGVPYITAIHVKDGSIDFDNCYYVSEEEHKVIYERCNPEKNDLLMVNIGSGTATPALVNVDFEFSMKNVALIKPNNKVIDSIFLEQFQLYVKDKLFHQLTSGGAQPFLSLKEIGKLLILVPNKIEQQKIAQILSAWDKAIELKEKLIEEKKKQKKGLMQKLLTGEVRLPGFDGEWEEVRLGEILKERNETGYETLELLAITGSRGIVKRDEVDIKDTSSEDKSKYKRIMPLDIGYNTMRMWQGVSGVSKYEGIVSPAYTVLKPTSKIDSFFIGYLFKTPKVINLFKRYSQGLVNDTLNLKYNNFKKIKLFIPKSIHEQKAIAQILSTADKEIELLEKELEQLKLQKKGLMQLLLTGIIRVKS
mgnify:CR=1 FL=1